MRYLRWTNADGDLGEGLVEEWTEVRDDGVVTREIGFDAAGRVAHRMPSKKYKYGKYGHFDLAPVSVDSGREEVPADLFERRWREDD